MKKLIVLAAMVSAATLSGCATESLESMGMSQVSETTGLDTSTLNAVKDGNVDALQDQAVNAAAAEAGVDKDLVNVAKDPSSVEGAVKAEANEKSGGILGGLF
jgi:outer membrane lipoprotein SlyB